MSGIDFGGKVTQVPLLERKRTLRRIVPNGSPFLLLGYVEGEGERLFELTCERDLEGVVAKHRQSRYLVDDNPASVPTNEVQLKKEISTPVAPGAAAEPLGSGRRWAN